MMKAYFEKASKDTSKKYFDLADENIVILTDGKTAKLFDGDSYGYYEGVDLYKTYAEIELYYVFLEKLKEGELDYDEIYSEIEIPYDDALERELKETEAYCFFEDKGSKPIAPAEGKYAKGKYAELRKYKSEDVEEIARIIRAANYWTDVEDECLEIVDIAEVYGVKKLRKKWNDPEYTMEEVMALAGKIFGVEIY